MYDVIIVGTGIAGLYCGLKIDKNKKVLLITKDKACKSNSYLAQGGISVLKDSDDFDLYTEDTMKAGHYINNKNAVEVLIKESRKAIDNLISYGVNLDKTNGELIYTKEGAHSINRIVHHKDITGKEVMEKLLDRVKQRENITIMEHTEVCDLYCVQRVCKGVILKDGTVLYGTVVVLATGGIGGLFKSSTNYRHITGDGIAIGLKHKLKMKDLGFVQIHPTALYTDNIDDRKFLISEAVRGEGAILLNHKGKRFVNELMPRDKVANAIWHEMRYSNKPYVYLDASHLGEEFLKTRFPNIYYRCLEDGYDMAKEPIRVVPAQHYFMGGIEVDLLGRTSMKGVYAIGETACTGVHGANRLASNSLLEGLVFGNRAAYSINQDLINLISYKDFDYLIQKNIGVQDLKSYRDMLMCEVVKRGENLDERWFENAR